MYFPSVASKKRLVVLSGAGISAESGIPTFRGADGLWEGHRIEEVASPQGWAQDKELVLDFYNLRRKAIIDADPNPGHFILADLEKHFDTYIVTQNIDDLHERAGSSKVLHLHGEIKKARSTADPNLVYNLDSWKIELGDLCEKGSQLRPHIVWFGEPVPLIEPAAQLVAKADVLVIVGTSMVVYPAAGLLHFASNACQKFVVDPNLPHIGNHPDVIGIEEVGSIGLRLVYERLVAQ